LHFKEENVREVVHVASVTKVAMVVVVVVMLTLVVEEAAEVKFALLSKRVNVIAAQIADSVTVKAVEVEMVDSVVDTITIVTTVTITTTTMLVYASPTKRVNVIVDQVADSVMEMVASEVVLFQIIAVVEELVELVEEVVLAMLSNVVNVKEAINANSHMKMMVPEEAEVEDLSVVVVTVKSVLLFNVVNVKEAINAAFLTKLVK